MEPNVFIAAAARSGSMHIANGFGRLGFKFASSHICLEGHHNEEHMIDFRAAAALFPLGGFVFQQHVRAVGANAAILAEYGVRPVVTYRNVLDSLYSLREQIDRAFTNGKPAADTHLPVHLPRWASLTESQKDWWIAYNMIPWYYTFYVSWLEASVEKLFVRYEDYYADQVTGIKRILDFYGLGTPSNDVLKEITSQHDGNFNVGRSGRGRMLPAGIAELAHEQTRQWGDHEAELVRAFLCGGIDAEEEGRVEPAEVHRAGARC